MSWKEHEGNLQNKYIPGNIGLKITEALCHYWTFWQKAHNCAYCFCRLAVGKLKPFTNF